MTSPGVPSRRGCCPSRRAASAVAMTAASATAFRISSATMAEYEAALVRERTQAGLEAARARGPKGGRKPKMTPELIGKAHRPAVPPTIMTRRGGNYPGSTSADAAVVSQPARSSPAASWKARQAAASAPATSAAATVITMTTRTLSRPWRTSESTSGPMTLLPGKLPPELAADRSPLPPAIFAGHAKRTW